MKKFNHPAMFPEELAARVIKLFSYRDDIILDPFNGVGTTTLVAKKLGRRYVGIDISPEYCKKAEERIGSIIT
ncbi:MAG: site-specific DNA-methyltransferase, partial [Candidatus Aureabacteria bacterium]|nr:site-specific DNA-methyltransferase [Candidatus Auribacterota bacterium]